MTEYNPIIHVIAKAKDVKSYHAEHGLETFTGWSHLHDIVHYVFRIGFTRYDELCVEIIYALCLGLEIDDIMSNDRVIGARKAADVSPGHLPTLVDSCHKLWGLYQIGVEFPVSKKCHNFNTILRFDNVAIDYLGEHDVWFRTAA